MTRAHRVGEVAIISGYYGAVRVANARAFRRDRAGWCLSGDGYIFDHDVIDVRRLVTIDPEDSNQVERLADDNLRSAIEGVLRVSVDDREWDRIVGAIQHGIASLVTPPNPEVYEHLTAGGGDILHALCGKVWPPNPADSVTVIGRCPECLRLAESGWTA